MINDRIEQRWLAAFVKVFERRVPAPTAADLKSLVADRRIGTITALFDG